MKHAIYIGFILGLLSTQVYLGLHQEKAVVTEAPTITGVGYEAIVGQGKGRIFIDGIEIDVEECQRLLGFTGTDVDDIVGGKTIKRMIDFNRLVAY